MRIMIEYQGCEWLLNQKLCTGKFLKKGLNYYDVSSSSSIIEMRKSQK